MATLSKLPLLALAALLVIAAGAPTRHVVDGNIMHATSGSSSTLIHEERFFKKIRRRISRAIKKVGRGIKKRAKRVTRRVRRVGRGIKRRARSVGRGIKRRVRSVGRGVGRRVRSVGRGVRRHVRRVGRGIRKGVKKIGKVAAHAAACNPASKAAFATAFATAVSAPAPHCRSMTAAEWARVGCSSPAKHRKTRICAPAVWGGVLGKIIKADAMALKRKIIFKRGITRSWLFNTSRGRALMRHELTHIRQQDGVSSFRWGYRYITGYCKAGRSYSRNKFEVEARRFQNDIC